MTDPRHRQLADVLVRHSTRVAPGEQVLVEAFDVLGGMVLALIAAIREAGGHPHVVLRDSRVQRALIDGAADSQLRAWAEGDAARMAQMDVYIGIRGADNAFEQVGIAEADQGRFGALYTTPVHMERRVPHTRWCVLNWPSPSMAQLAGQSTEAFEDHFFKVCTFDYARMAEAMAPLRAAMAAADRVRIKGPGETDLAFSIKGIGAVPCVGNHNIPDGECFSAPVLGSAQGVVRFNTPSLYRGQRFDDVRLRFEAGRVVDASASQGAEALAALLDTDAGARRLGEFAVGFHPHLTEPAANILFDEKIAGSLHLTLGQAYDVASNGNRSDIQWALVLIQRPEYGGGELWFDDTLIRKDGLFVPEALQALNPGSLGAAQPSSPTPETSTP